ncbi:MAG: DHA2 family efflux MFS transporter permease subunit [Propionibacteriaceae bacterium]|nr:DHA2 family efflux MFS transporter permease subunit [Propionibacteriaceae bacterium]
MTPTAADAARANPWPALWALVTGFFMILVDASIVNVANPAIMTGLGADYSGVIWVTSAYLLTFAVPLLVTGRLGDRYGPRRVYLTGLALFTVASLACGLAGELELLIAARAVQGFGASLMSPQSMAVITRLFPAERRGVAMGVWGSVAGVAMLVGPVLGGLLVSTLGWEWIFFINVPVGVVAFWIAARYVPALERHPHRFDLLGVVLSALGMFLLVFGLQEGQTHDWGAVWGPISVWGLIGAGVVILGLFVWWQVRNPGEPLLPLALLRDRNFSLANTAISLVGFAVTCYPLPVIFYVQDVRGFSALESGLLLLPSALMSVALARWVGRRVDRVDARIVATQGLAATAVGIVGYVLLIGNDLSPWWLLVPNTVLGFGMASIWAPISTAATRNLPLQWAGAGSGLYNTTRQVGSVLGSASIAAAISWRTAAHASDEAGTAAAMSEALWLPVLVLAGALVVVALFAPRASADASAQERRSG